MLYEVWPAGAYCGPSALAAITGLDAKKDLRAVINRARGVRDNQGIMGLCVMDMAKAIRALGYETEFVTHASRNMKDRPTLYDFASLPIALGRGPLIVCLTRHYVALESGMIHDNRMRAGEHVSQFRGRRAHVSCAWRILNQQQGILQL